MHVDPLLPVLAALGLSALVVGLVLRKIGQPAMLGYLLVGVLLGPHAIGLVESEEALSRAGGLGVVLLLFFVGMELDPRRLLANWRLAIFGTLLQVAISVACVWGLGHLLAWPFNRVVLLGFVISLSSTAVVLRLLQDRGETSTPVGQQVTAILLAQDVMIVPMLLAIGLMKGERVSASMLGVQIAGGVAFAGMILWIAKKGEIRLGIGKILGGDRELQVFAALIVVFGLAFLTGLAGLSTALGALLAGMLVSAARETHWVHGALEPFRFVFVAVFFVAVGMLLDLRFMMREWPLVLALTLVALLTNTVINACILRVFGSGWRRSLYGGALLAQIGELSFILVAVGKHAELVSEFAYQVTIATITLSLILSPSWLLGARALTRERA